MCVCPAVGFRISAPGYTLESRHTVLASLPKAYGNIVRRRGYTRGIEDVTINVPIGKG